MIITRARRTGLRFEALAAGITLDDTIRKMFSNPGPRHAAKSDCCRYTTRTNVID